jgi:prolyl oligopeptidase
LRSKRRWSAEELCRAIDLACVFYFKRVRCLQHSSALTLLMLRHGWDAEVVIGGRILPVGFHAWTQTANMVVNENADVLGRYRILARW